MRSIYEANSLPFWNEREIETRDFLARHLARELESAFRERNPAWSFERIESPMLIPRELLSEEYSSERIFALAPKASALRLELAADWKRLDAAEKARLHQAARSARDDERKETCESLEDFEREILKAKDSDEAAESWPEARDAAALEWARARDRLPPELALRPETTPATYAWMREELKAARRRPPYCCWQLNKSFRRERDQPARHMRLKEFWQQEFQFAYAADTKDDYQAFSLEVVRSAIEAATRCPTRIVVADRLPAYSARTFDIECWNSEKWMEICSISKRVDFPDRWRAKADREVPLLVLEVATSPDRQMYCLDRWRSAWETLPSEELSLEAPPESFVDNQAALERLLEREESRRR